MTDATSVAADQLRSVVERAERLREDRKAIDDDLKELFKEARSSGFDTKVLKKIIADRSKPAAEREEFAAIYQLYMEALEGSRTSLATRARAA